MLRTDKVQLHVSGRCSNISHRMNRYSVILDILVLRKALYPRALIRTLGTDNAEQVDICRIIVFAVFKALLDIKFGKYGAKSLIPRLLFDIGLIARFALLFDLVDVLGRKDLEPRTLELMNVKRLRQISVKAFVDIYSLTAG